MQPSELRLARSHPITPRDERDLAVGAAGVTRTTRSARCAVSGLGNNGLAQELYAIWSVCSTTGVRCFRI